jgi:tetratricopeptide (TPR) repeat protein
MAKKLMCAICEQQPGKRACRARRVIDDAIAEAHICPRCCAVSRDAACAGCAHYDTAARYTEVKEREAEKRHFIAEIGPELEDAVNRALERAERGETAAAEATLGELAKEHPRSHLVQFGMGVVNCMKKEFDKAIVYFERATEIFPYYADAHFNKAMAFREKEDLLSMVKAFRQVVKFGDPKDESTRTAHEILGDFEKIARDLRCSSAEAYLEGEVRFKKGFELMQKHKWEKALACFEESLKFHPMHVPTNGNIGICHGMLGRRANALTALDRALELDPEYEPALINRAGFELLAEGEKPEPGTFTYLECNTSGEPDSSGAPDSSEE